MNHYPDTGHSSTPILKIHNEKIEKHNLSSYREAIALMKMQVFDGWKRMTGSISFMLRTRPCTYQLCLLLKAYIRGLDFI